MHTTANRGYGMRRRGFFKALAGLFVAAKMDPAALLADRPRMRLFAYNGPPVTVHVLPSKHGRELQKIYNNTLSATMDAIKLQPARYKVTR